MADDGEDVLVGDDVLRVGHAHIGFGLVVEGHEFHLEAHLLERPLVLLDRELRAELDSLAQRRLTAAEGTLGGDLDGALALGLELGSGGDGDQREGHRRRERRTQEFHGYTLLLDTMGRVVGRIIAAPGRLRSST
jgi:hypothetical protein